jgi:Zinc finger, C3HC4 type (RING finger)
MFLTIYDNILFYCQSTLLHKHEYIGTQQWGEYRDRRRRWQHAEQRSKLTSVERQKAQQLQMEFRTRCCPICLENYDYGDTLPNEDLDDDVYVTPSMGKPEPSTNSLASLLGDPRKGIVDECGIPRRGADGRKIKLLRCGHVFCETCWRSWVHSTACGSPCSCPVCRQDVGKSACRSQRSQSVPALTSSNPGTTDGTSRPASDRFTTATTASASRRTTLTRNGQSYDSIAPRVNRPNTNTRIVRVNTMLRGAILFRQTSAIATRSTDYVVEQSNDENTPLLSV